MSIRLHELAKKIGMDNKDLLALLKQRDYPVKTVSSTIDKITAEALEQELGPRKAEEAAPAPVAAGAEKAEETAVLHPEAPPAAPVFTTHVPAGVFVRSAQDIAREKEEIARATRPQVVFPAPRPAPPPIMRAPPAPTRPPMMAPPVSRPAPVPPPAPRPAPVSAPPLPPPVARPALVAPPPAAPPPSATPFPPPPLPTRAVSS
ncbi:MAG TPA: translation initiation factor IF-2 N-terminal domain-containing protein, partial [Opitutaceae bacterium]|nr:translation initiation factor IF-2 N-terminal domain-containing protein [Opitutaceae bacterium]